MHIPTEPTLGLTRHICLNLEKQGYSVLAPVAVADSKYEMEEYICLQDCQDIRFMQESEASWNIGKGETNQKKGKEEMNHE